MNNPDFGIFTFLDKIILQYMQKKLPTTVLENENVQLYIAEGKYELVKRCKTKFAGYPVSGIRLLDQPYIRPDQWSMHPYP